jgi:hypothetical protein
VATAAATTAAATTTTSTAATSASPSASVTTSPLAATTIHLVIGSLNYTKNGATLTNDVAPYISRDNRTMVPLRMIAETFGANVEWQEATRTVVITLGDVTLRITADQPLANDMGTAVIVDERTFVPIRYISESFGAEVEWNAQNQSVDIVK